MSERQNIDTILTDLDLAFGTAALNFNQDGSGGIMDALAQPDRVDSTLIDRLMTKLGAKLSLLNGPSTVDRTSRSKPMRWKPSSTWCATPLRS